MLLVALGSAEVLFSDKLAQNPAYIGNLISGFFVVISLLIVTLPQAFRNKISFAPRNSGGANMAIDVARMLM